jgi:hypothetical protein
MCLVVGHPIPNADRHTSPSPCSAPDGSRSLQELSPPEGRPELHACSSTQLCTLRRSGLGPKNSTDFAVPMDRGTQSLRFGVGDRLHLTFNLT